MNVGVLNGLAKPVAAVASASTLAYTPVTAPQPGVTVPQWTALAGLTATVTVPAGRRIRVTGYVYQFDRTSGTATYVALSVLEAGVELSRKTEALPNTYAGAVVEAVISPSAGTHTYYLGAYSDGILTMQASTTVPAWILVEDITGTVWPAGSAVTAGMVASEAWTDYTPTLTQGVTVTKTVNYARYMKVGRMVTVQGFLTVTGAGTAGQPIIIGLPFTAVYNSLPQEVGTGTVFDSSASQAWKGQGILQSATTVYFRASGSSGSVLGTVDMSAGLAVGDQVSFTAAYEATS